MQISCAATVQLISTFVFATLLVQILLISSQNFKRLVGFCDCTGEFVSDLVGNPKEQFCRDVVHIIMQRYDQVLYGHLTQNLFGKTNQRISFRESCLMLK